MTRKFSIDLTDENRVILNEVKGRTGTPIGQTINFLVTLFCRIPSDVKAELLAFCKEKLTEISDRMKYAGEYETQSLMNKYGFYRRLAVFFNDGNDFCVSVKDEEPKMQRIEMLGGVLVCPADYIILNREDAKNSLYASVVEVRHAGYGVPHFVFFSSREAKTYTRSDTNFIEDLCAREWPRFRDIMDRVVELVYDPNAEEQNFSTCLNAKVAYEAPQIGHFGVYVQGDRDYPSNYKPPMGVKIIVH